MKILIPILLLMFTKTTFAFDTVGYCRKVADAVGGSYQIEETCRKEENRAREKLNNISIPPRIEKYCREVANAVGGSYQIMETCVRQELAAKNRLRE